MTIQRYHGYTNWQTRYTEDDVLERDFTFGFELEVQRMSRESPNCEKMAAKLSRRFGKLFIYERDSSIGEGFEVISQPVTWRWFVENLEEFRDLLSMLEHNGYRSHDGNKCGLHVHIGRDSLHGVTKEGNDLVEQNVITNILFMLERFQEEFFKFSRRSSNTLTRWSKFRTDLVTLENGSRFIDKKLVSDSMRCQNRYCALNLNNSKTIEFRLFRGTLRFETFFLTMNLVKNCIEQAKIPNNLVRFVDLVRSGLDDEQQVWADEYLSKRRIDQSDALISLTNVLTRPRMQSSEYADLLSILDD
ncbi:amidoligase family protein [Faecalibaculum rodentium]|uniref:amidoligase family protein n=1 Tax=Faecalibaculum rodentium TaxID=1702221 RepID=UPI0026702E71|nr:amidoligase family protein [Faecalibaculum rodentium]